MGSEPVVGRNGSAWALGRTSLQLGTPRCAAKGALSMLTRKTPCLRGIQRVIIHTKVIATPAPYTPPNKKQATGYLPGGGGMITDIVYDPGCYTTRNNRFTIRIHQINLQYL
jgi:NAD(P)-dependent dehydrogenase (short-subunit alcohol dehydrogenase family)